MTERGKDIFTAYCYGLIDTDKISHLDYTKWTDICTEGSKTWPVM
jgi:hypothetical protein